MTIQRTCRVCGLVVLHAVARCPACTSPDLVPARLGRTTSPVGRDVPAEPGERHPLGENGESPHDTCLPDARVRAHRWEVLHRCPNEFVALTLQAELERSGIVSVIRPLGIPGYPGVGLPSTAWGLLLVDEEDLGVAAGIVSVFLAAVEGEVD